MINIKHTVFIGILGVLYSCGTKDSVNHITNADDEYVRALQRFPDSLVSNFPNKIGDKAIFSFGYGSKYENVHLELYLKFSSKETDSLINVLSTTSIAKYESMDSCLLIVNRFTRIDKYGIGNSYKSELALPKNCIGGYYPVPNFWRSEYKSNQLSNKLEEGFDIYVTDAHSGSYWEETDNSWGRYLPDEWKEGFSNGVAINKQKGIVVYWVCVW